MASYMSLADYAKTIGTDTETALDQLRSAPYQPFWKEQNGKVLVSFDVFTLDQLSFDLGVRSATGALRSEGGALTPTAEQAPEATTEPEQKEDPPALPEIEKPDTEEVERLRRENEELKAQIRQKDQQIADYTLKFAELAQQAQQIAGQAQYLQLSDKLDEPKEKKIGFWRRLLGS